MALRKIYMTQYGVEAQYYMVSGVNANRISQTASITIYGYPNKVARDNNCNPMHSLIINVYPDKFDRYFSVEALQGDADNNQYKQAYLFLKENEQFFLDAEDLLDEAPTNNSDNDDTIGSDIPIEDIEEVNYTHHVPET